MEMFFMLNWIIKNRTVLTLKTYLRLTELFEIELFWQKLYLYWTELFEIKLTKSYCLK